MKSIGIRCYPCLRTSTKFRLFPYVARAYTTSDFLLRRFHDGAITGFNCGRAGARSLGHPNRSLARCFGRSSVTPTNAEGRDPNSRQHEADDRWPRLTIRSADIKSCREFHEQYRTITRGETKPEEVHVRGRVFGFRTASAKLAFVDLVQDNVKLQVVCKYPDFEAGAINLEDFSQLVDNLKRGDIISVVGHPHRTSRNELSILISEVPQLLSPCVRQLPMQLKNEESRMRLRHVDFLIRPEAARILKLGSDIKKFLREFLEENGHISVKTPILADDAGGAVAKPFYTKGFEERSMALRIAPELWLKRLIIGGFERVYEIGPSFRNEGERYSRPTTSGKH